MKGHINSVGSSQTTYTPKTDPFRRIVQIDTQVVITRRCETMIVIGAPLRITRQMYVKTHNFLFHVIPYRSIPHRSAQLGGVYMNIWPARTRLAPLLGDYQRKI